MQGKWLRNPTGETSVVFVHGILSSGENCWQHQNGTYWPELLKQEPDLTSIGIYVYSYQTGFMSGGYSLSNVADDLKERMFTLDQVVNGKKVVFVCHSMGGIIVRKLIVERLNDFLDRQIEIGLYLVASPSLGSDYANWLEPIAKFAGHEQAKALRFSQDNQWLNDLDKNFINLKESNRLKIHGKELLEDKFVTLPSIIHKQVVEPFSGARYFGESFKVAGSDHFSIAKPESTSSDQHRLLKAYLLNMEIKQGTKGALITAGSESPASKTQPILNNSESVKVYVSYSWATEKDTQIVEELERLCSQRDIRLIRDSAVLKHGDSINKFMEDLSQGDHIITIFSKPYFESKWCMYELLSTYRQLNFKDRTHPVIADNCNLQDSDYRLKVGVFWDHKHREEESKLVGLDPKLVLNEHKQVQLYRDISQNINDLLNFAAVRVTTPLTALQNQNYAQLLDCIRPITEHDGKLAQQSDDDFLQQIQKNLETDLNKSEHSAFRECLIKSFNYKISDTQKLPYYLIEQCISGQFVQVIQYIESAFADCYGNIAPTNFSAIKMLYDIAEGTVSKLIVFNIKNEWMAQYRKDYRSRSRHEHIFPEMTSGHVEVVASREACTIPKFYLDKHSMNLQGGRGVGLESGIKASDVLSDIIKRIYSRVMKTELTADLDENKAIANLQRTLQQRKQKPNLKLRENYFLLLPTTDNASGLADKAVQENLRKLLPDLSLIRIKTGCFEEIFIVEDEDLMTAIREFFITLENYNAK